MEEKEKEGDTAVLGGILIFFGFCFFLCLLAYGIDFSGLFSDALWALAAVPLICFFLLYLALPVVSMYFAVRKKPGSKALWWLVTTVELLVSIVLMLWALAAGSWEPAVCQMFLVALYFVFSYWFARWQPKPSQMWPPAEKKMRPAAETMPAKSAKVSAESARKKPTPYETDEEIQSALEEIEDLLDEINDLRDELEEVEPEAAAEVQQFLADEALASRFQQILAESLQLMESTVYPKTFFGRYDEAVKQARQIIAVSPSDAHVEYAREVLADLRHNREDMILNFISRCEKRGRLCAVKEELLSGDYRLPPAAVAYLERLLQQETAEEAEEAPPCGEYIYCSLSFGNSGKTYYYRTEDETLACGDEVIVPVGDEGKKSVATIVEIRRFPVGETPYPPGKTRKILGKCPY